MSEIDSKISEINEIMNVTFKIESNKIKAILQDTEAMIQ